MPSLPSLTHHLADCPADFLAEPRLGTRGTVEVAAVVADVIQALGGEPLQDREIKAFQSTNGAQRNRLRLVLIGCWLLHAPEFKVLPALAPAALAFLLEIPQDLAAHVSAEQFVADPDRREELVRLCLHHCGLQPAGETEAQAQDRLATLSTTQRQRVIAAAQAAEQRASQIRAEMARQAALDAQMKSMRE